MLPAEGSKMASASGGTWRPYKELLSVVEKAVYRKRPEVFHKLDVALKKYKPDFLSLLKNPAKNPNHRQQIKGATTQGIQLQGQTEKHKFPEQFVQEVLIISDILNLNEYACVDLLLAGEQQQPNFPGLTRGLVSVLLYHDGRRSLVSALRTLIQSREGVTWTLGLNEDLLQLVTSYTDSLRDEGLTTKILQQLEELNLQTELDKLQQGQGIGDDRHKQQLIDFITDQRQLLTECLFCFACQSPLPKRDCLQILSYLKKCQVTEVDGTLDSVTLTVLFALLACFSVDPLDNAADMQTSFDENSLQLLSDQSFVPELHQEIITATGWENAGLCAVIQLAWALVLRSCSQWPSLVGVVEVLEDDEGVLDMAVDGNVFQFLRYCVVAATNFKQEEYFVRQLHSLVTGFIVKMPLKIKELRNQGDEAARILRDHLQEGVPPPQDLPRHFEDFMRLICDLYDEDPLGLELSSEFWCPPDPLVAPFSPLRRLSPAYRQRTSQKQVSLYKFVRLAGDLLPTSLFVPYLGMLTGLSSSPQGAHHCFNLLKSSTNSTLSWDHFFTSIKQYYMEMRQSAGHTVTVFGSGLSHAHRPHTPNRGITTEELDGLQAVLCLTERVAEQDENARIAMCESQAWLPIASLFGLLGCPVSANLKAHLLRTLAAFAISPEIASSMWHTLELSQVLQTVRTGQAAQEGGILVELNEIEARNEMYPETRGFLKLLSSLTDNPIPPSLGAGYRAPGFEPYLQFIRDSVFLKFHSRSYRNPNEKWQVASGTLEVLFKLLEGYTPQAEHFVDQFLELQGGERTLVPRPPGHSLMKHMLNDTPMLRMILSIIDSASEILEQLSPLSEEKEDLERTALLCLRMIEVALDKQEEFLSVLRSVAQSSSIMVTPLDQLLLSINPQTHTADYLLKITRFLTHMHTGAELSLSVVKILCRVSHSAAVQSHIVGLLTANSVESLQLLIGFVDHLDITEPEDMLEKDLQEIGQDYIDVKSYSSTQIRNATRQNIVRLMLHSLEYPGPNLAHFLLGFELRKPVNKTTLQDPGVLGAPKTCLHAVLDILNKGVDSHRGPACVTETPKLTELAYQLIYHLCANKGTSMPILRYLRTSHDFLYRHLQHLPFKALVAVEAEDRVNQVRHVSVINQQSWLVKAAAIELKVTAQGRQRSHTQRLLALLFNEPSVAAGLSRTQTSTLVSRRSDDFPSSSRADESSLFATDIITGQSNFQRKILSILESVEFKQDYPPPLQLNYFDPAVTERVISSCEQKSEESGVMYCNVHMLHRLLMNEISGVQGAATAGQKSFLVQEVREILQNVVQRNIVRESLYIKKESFESWRQVVEVVLATCPTDILPTATRQAVIAETLQDLLVRIAEEQALPELTAPVSGVILTLMTHLCQSTLSLEGHDPTSSLLYGTTKGHLLTFSGSTQPTGALFAILRGLIDTVLRSGGGMQRVRANLYATLLYYMRMIQRTDSLKEHGVLGVLSSQPGESMDAGTLSILSSYGEPFMETVCRDACDGHDVGRMLAFSLLDAIINIDWQQRWLLFLNLKGYLRHMIENLVKDDERLQMMLDPSPEPLKALYIYESKMALLARIAQSAEGAKVLLQSGLMSRLAECQFLDQRPEREQSIASVTSGFHSYDFMTSMSRDSFVPTVMERYRQLFIPALKVTLAVLNSLGSQHQEAATQVLHFVLSHSEVFISILQDRALVHNLASLQELALVTSIVCNAGLIESSILSSEAVMRDQLRLKGPLARVQRLMFDLLPRYCSSQGWDKIIKALVEQSFSEEELESLNKKNSLVAMEATMKLYQICSNVIGYCRLVSSSSGPVAPYCHVIFAPSITDVLSREMHRGREGVRQSTAMSSRPPGLGVLVSVIKDCTEQIVKAIDIHRQMSSKLQNLPELSSEEIRELSSLQAPYPPQEKLSTQQRQQVAQKCLTQIVSFKDKEIASHFYIIENALFILWRHMDFYYLHCVPSDDERSRLNQSGSTSARLRRLQEFSSSSLPGGSQSPQEDSAVGLGVTREEIETLKRESASCLTESLLKRIAEIEQQHGVGRTRIGFVQALVRRVRRLLTLYGAAS